MIWTTAPGSTSPHPESWPLFRVTYAGTDGVCTTTPFGWNESPLCYRSFIEANPAYLCSRGIPDLAYIDVAWYGNLSFTFGCSEKVQWLSAAEPLHVGMLVSYFMLFIDVPLRFSCRTPSTT